MNATGRRSRWLARLKSTDGSPGAVAAACALGIFFSFSPFLGLQTVLAMTGAVALRLNKVAVFVGLNANLPWFMGPWYAATTACAAAFMDVGIASAWAQIRLAFDDGTPSFEVWRGALAPLIGPFIVGASVGAAAVALIGYVMVAAVLRARAGRDAKTPVPPKTQPPQGYFPDEKHLS